MGYLMTFGDTLTRRFASTVLDKYLDFTSREVTYSRQIDWLHKHFQEEVKEGLYPAMSDAEIADYLMRETLKINNMQAEIDLIYCGDR